jgi:CMP-N-acetylneuraminic acid synthetase
MTTLGIIPARAGSERLPGKNLVDLGGKPLIAWTIEAALAATALDKVLVSTDSPEIAFVAEEHGCIVQMRPPDLAQADTPSLSVVKYVANAFPDADTIALLQPTSPFRTVSDIVGSYNLLKGTKGDAVVSVTDVPEDMAFEVGHAQRLRPSQGVVVPNGAIYWITRDHLMSNGTWYTGVSYAYKMPKDRSLDIDTRLDLEIARLIVRRQAA